MPAACLIGGGDGWMFPAKNAPWIRHRTSIHTLPCTTLSLLQVKILYHQDKHYNGRSLRENQRLNAENNTTSWSSYQYGWKSYRVWRRRNSDHWGCRRWAGDGGTGRSIGISRSQRDLWDHGITNYRNLYSGEYIIHAFLLQDVQSLSTHNANILTHPHNMCMVHVTCKIYVSTQQNKFYCSFSFVAIWEKTLTLETITSWYKMSWRIRNMPIYLNKFCAKSIWSVWGRGTVKIIQTKHLLNFQILLSMEKYRWPSQR